MRQKTEEMTSEQSKRHDDIGAMAGSSSSARRAGMGAAVSDEETAEGADAAADYPMEQAGGVEVLLTMCRRWWSDDA
jgi:hypothetical protein